MPRRPARRLSIVIPYVDAVYHAAFRWLIPERHKSKARAPFLAKKKWAVYLHGLDDLTCFSALLLLIYFFFLSLSHVGFHKVHERGKVRGALALTDLLN